MDSIWSWRNLYNFIHLSLVAYRYRVTNVMICKYGDVFFFFLKDICFREKQLELEPTAVSRACLTCMQEPIGKSLSLYSTVLSPSKIYGVNDGRA